AHEAVHCDEAPGLFEEVAAAAFDTLLYLQLVAVMPEIALDGSELTLDQNVTAISMINSGRALPESIGLLPSPGIAQAFPGAGLPYASFADRVAASYDFLPNESPDEGTAVQYVEGIAARTGLPTGSPFNLL